MAKNSNYINLKKTAKNRSVWLSFRKKLSGTCSMSMQISKKKQSDVKIAI